MWLDVAEELGPFYGEFVPVSPMIAAMVSSERDRYKVSESEVVADIRRGAARQHLDYVFVHEVTATSKKADKAFALADTASEVAVAERVIEVEDAMKQLAAASLEAGS